MCPNIRSSSPHSQRDTQGIRRGLAVATLTVLLIAACTAPPTAERDPLAAPVLVIGVDGLEWSVLLPLLRQGRLPVLAGLMERGIYGQLSTLVPTYSPVIWTTVATGKMPHGHGIKGFIKPDAPPEAPILYSNRDRTTKALWNIFSERGQRVATVGWWMTFPAEPVNGVMVAQTNTAAQIADAKSGLGVWKGGLLRGLEGQVHPPERHDSMLAIAAEVEAELAQRSQAAFGPLEGSFSTLTERLWNTTGWAFRADSTYLEIGRLLLTDTEPWDLMMIYFGGTDVVAHRFWRYMEPERFRHRPEAAEVERFGGLIADYYAFVDGAIGTLLADLEANLPDAMAGEMSVLVLSDHGMVPINPEQRFDPDDPPENVNSGGHNRGPAGVLVAAGPHFRHAEAPLPSTAKGREDLPHLGSVLDIAPTVLALKGLPVGEDVDGTVLEGLFVDGFFERYPRRTVATYDTPGWREARPDPPLSPKAEAERLEQLRALGYIQ